MSRPRPSIEAIAEARGKVIALLNYFTRDPDIAQYVDGTEAMALQTLLDAIEPPTHEEIVRRYDEFLKRKGYADIGNGLAWFADGVEAFIGRERGR